MCKSQMKFDEYLSIRASKANIRLYMYVFLKTRYDTNNIGYMNRY